LVGIIKGEAMSELGMWIDDDIKYGETAPIIKALEKLSESDMHVKLIGSDLKGVFRTPLDTHYVMQGETVVHTGNSKTVIDFALRLKP
jgi:hypothetical protein